MKVKALFFAALMTGAPIAASGAEDVSWLRDNSSPDYSGVGSMFDAVETCKYFVREQTILPSDTANLIAGDLANATKPATSVVDNHPHDTPFELDVELLIEDGIMNMECRAENALWGAGEDKIWIAAQRRFRGYDTDQPWPRVAGLPSDQVNDKNCSLDVRNARHATEFKVSLRRVKPDLVTLTVFGLSKAENHMPSEKLTYA